MDHAKIVEAAEQFQQVLGEETVNALGKEVEFAKRLRLLTPFRLVTALLGALGGQAVQCIADLHRAFNALFDTNMAYKPFHNQLAKRKFAPFMKAIAQRAWQTWAVQVLGAPPSELFGEFRRIVIQDGSSFAVKDSLRHVWPGRFHTHSPAAVELHAGLELLSGSLIALELTADTDSERAHAPPPQSLAGCLHLADRGYFDKRYLAEVNRHGGFFIVRAPTSINPIVRRVAAAGGRPLPHWKDIPLKRIRYHLPKDVPIELDVKWKGPGGQDLECRLVLTWSPGHGEYMHLVTNLPRERYDAATVRTGYRLRWQVELLFKEWKSHANLRAFDTEKPPIAEGLIWAAIAAGTLKRYLAHAAQHATGVETSTLRAAACGTHVVLPLLRALKTGTDAVLPALERALRYLANNAPRAHPKRDRSKGRSTLGLEPVPRPA